MESLMTNSLSVAALPGLLSGLTEEQRGVLIALAGMDADAPRTLAEAAELLQQSPEALAYQQALANRALLRGIVTPDPAALRLMLAVCAEGVAESVSPRGKYTLHGIFPALWATQFPAGCRFSLVTLWTGGTVAETYPVGVQVKTPAGEVLLRTEQELHAPGVGAQYLQEFRLQMTFPDPGLYPLEIWLDGAPLYVQYLPVLAHSLEDDDGKN